MKGYFAALGMKAIGSASAIRVRREPLYGSADFADRINPDRDFSDTAATHDVDDVESVLNAAAALPMSAAIALQRAQAPVGEGRSQAAAPEAEHTPDNHAAPAMAIQYRELQQRLESRAAASDKAVSDLAPHAEKPQRREAPSPADGMRRKAAADREDSAAPPRPVLRAERDRPPRLNFNGVDRRDQRSVAQQELRTIPIDATAGRSGNVSANAARSLHATKTHAAKSIAGNSLAGASIAADQARDGLHAQPGSAILIAGNVGPGVKAEATREDILAVETYVEQPGPARKNRESLIRYRPLEIDAYLSATRDESSGKNRPSARTVDTVKRAEKSARAAATRQTHLQTVDRPAASRARSVPDDAPPPVQVSIGKIEIREQRQAPPAPARRAQPPRLDLKEYLNRRLRGVRHE
jgi:hypothetical protein